MKAIGVIRLSTQEQAEQGKAGIDRQKSDIETAAHLHNLEIIRTIEVIESGAKVRGQRDFEQVFRDLKDGVADGVVCSNLDRLVRPDVFADFAVFDHFRTNRKKIWTPGECVDPSSQSGFLVSGVRGLLAGLERQLIVARTTATKEELRRRGWHPGGEQLLPRAIGVERIREGRRTVGFRWFYKEPDATLMRRAYQLLFEGHSYRSIAAKIGNGWTGMGIRTSMLNTIWCGVRTFTPTADRAEPMERRVIPEAEALITRETWERAAAIIAGRKKQWGARQRPPRFLLTGLLRCSHCGRIYYTKARGIRDTTRRLEYYMCGSGVRGPSCGARALESKAAEREIMKIIKTRFRDPEFLLWLVNQAARPPETKTDAAKIARELAGLETKRERVVDLAVDGVIDKAECSKRLAAIDQRRTVKAIAEYFAGFEEQPVEEQRRILRGAFQEFRVENGAIPALAMNGTWFGSVAKVSSGSTPR